MYILDLVPRKIILLVPEIRQRTPTVLQVHTRLYSQQTSRDIELPQELVQGDDAVGENFALHQFVSIEPIETGHFFAKVSHQNSLTGVPHA